MIADTSNPGLTKAEQPDRTIDKNKL